MSWLRKSSSIAVVIVTDQYNECHTHNDHNDENDGPASALPPDALCLSSNPKALLADMRPQGNGQVYGLLPSIDFWQEHIAQDPGVVDIFTVHGSVTADSYDTTLQNISKHVHDTLEDVFTLSHVPVSNVEVKVNGNDVDASLYTIEKDSNIIRFDKNYLPSSGSNIEVSYRYFSK